jgi:protein O-mannosyl-transferase
MNGRMAKLGQRNKASGELKFARVLSHPVCLGLLLVVATFLVYLPALPGKFVWDDDAWTTGLGRVLRDFSGLGSMWCRPTTLQQYYPLTATTFWLDYHAWGFWTLPYHVENVLLHALAALLFWRLLWRFRVPGAWLAAAIFALHPVMVESVGWITERKNVLSFGLYLGALLAYGRYALFWTESNPSAADGISARRRNAYALAFLLFLGALLAKATAVSFPAVILLAGWWQRGRIRWRADVLPVSPFLAAAIGISLLVAWLEKNHLGATGVEWNISFPERCLIAGRAFWFYIGKLLWPAHLCFVYPRWQPDVGRPGQWIYPAAALVILIWPVLAQKRIGRGPATAVWFYCGTLFPLLGFINAYGMRYSWVWDHWSYFSNPGLIALGAALLARAAERFRVPAMLYGFAAVVLPVLGILTWRQAGMYADLNTLWRTTIARNPGAFLAYNNLGGSLLRDRQVDEAMAHFQRALEIQPNNVEAIVNLGLAYSQIGRLNEAMAEYRRALELEPNNAETHDKLGGILLRQGQLNEAIGCFQKALELQPDNVSTLVNLGCALVQQNQPDAAMVCYQKALAIDPENAPAHSNLGNILFRRGLVDEAVEHYRRALKSQPDYTDAHNNLGVALLTLGKADEALAHWREAVKIDPRSVSGWNSLAWVLATSPTASVRNGAEAVAMAQRANELTGGRNPLVLRTLAAAYAESGRFTEATETARQALQLATAQSNTGLMNTLAMQLKLYEAGLPFRDTN